MNRRWRPELLLGAGCLVDLHAGEKGVGGGRDSGGGPASVARQRMRGASQSGEVHHNVSGLLTA
jgi:hypothetical protein